MDKNNLEELLVAGAKARERIVERKRTFDRYSLTFYDSHNKIGEVDVMRT
jgi:hypothetical protein